MAWTGLIQDGNCTWCWPGKYQTGAGLIEEVNCTWCSAGKYQTGSGLIGELNCTWCNAGKYQTGSGQMLEPFSSSKFRVNHGFDLYLHPVLPLLMYIGFTCRMFFLVGHCFQGPLLLGCASLAKQGNTRLDQVIHVFIVLVLSS